MPKPDCLPCFIPWAQLMSGDFLSLSAPGSFPSAEGCVLKASLCFSFQALLPQPGANTQRVAELQGVMA